MKAITQTHPIKNVFRILFALSFLLYFNLRLSSQTNTDLISLMAVYNSIDEVYRPAWDTTESPCTWSGVTCDETTGRVIQLEMRGHPYMFNYQGSIPEAIGGLDSLRVLNISGHAKLTGSIPASIGNLTKLEYLNLKGNSISGNIPISIGGLSHLKYLDLSNNQLSGNIPISLGNLTNILDLNLSFNDSLANSIPSTFGNLTNIEYLYLAGIGFTGPIPPFIGNLTTLKGIEFHQNDFSDSIPSSLGNLVNLEFATFYENMFSGCYPASLGSWCPIKEEIDFSNNPLLKNQNFVTFCTMNDGLKVTYYQDADGDTFGNPLITKDTCALPMGYVANNTDCDDTNAAIKPTGTEICNAIDDNCNSIIDDGIVITYYRDEDGDTFGNSLITKDTCAQPMGYVANNTDCDDTNAAIKPTGTEVCNAIDDNCNSLIDDGIANTFYRDADGDTYGTPLISKDSCAQPVGYVSNNTDCNDADVNVHLEILWYLDADSDGYGGDSSRYFCNDPNIAGGGIVSRGGPRQSTNNWVINSDDFNDNDANSYPGAPEICDGLDNNNNGSIDEGLLVVTYYQDADGDGFGNINIVKDSCAQPVGYVINNTDCNDGNSFVNPGVIEIQLNGIDDDCNGQIDCPPVTIEFNSTHCSFAFLPWSTTPVTASGDYSQLYVSQCGGDSTVIYHITINPVHSIIVNVDACQTYTLPWSATVSTNGVYTHSYTNQYGCDSTLIYSVNFPTIVRDTNYASGCDSVEINFASGPKKFYTSQIYPDTLIFLGECSTITYWLITVNNNYSTRDTIVNCVPFNHPILGFLHDTTVINHTYQSIHNCDSIVTYQVYVGEQIVTEIGPLVGCDSLGIPGIDTFYFSQTHSITLTSSNGCDSLIFYHIEVNNSSTSSFDFSTCNSYTWLGDTYYTSGTYRDTSINPAGCPHYATLNLTILPAPPKPIIQIFNPNCYELGRITITNFPGNNYLYVSKLIDGQYAQGYGSNNLDVGKYAVRTQSDNLCYSDTAFAELIKVPNITWYQDADGDGFGNPLISKDTCGQPMGYSYNNQDIDDNNPNVNVLHSIGNMVFKDMDDNGYFNAGESTVENVKLLLYKNMQKVDSTLTNMNGLYLFDTLSAGDYTVVIDSSNFEIGGPLHMLNISSNNNCGPGIFGGQDGANNGALNMFGRVASCVITFPTLFGGPLFEYPNNDTSGATDENSNLTIDFGFTPPPPLGSCGNQNSYMHLSSQAEVDAFPSSHPGCTYYRGSLKVYGENIQNLDSLIYLEKIGNLFIGENGNSLVNPLLTNLNGLNNLKSVANNLQIYYNQALTDLSALSMLDSVGLTLSFRGNQVISDLSPIQNIHTIGQSLDFGLNNSLYNFPNFVNLNDDAIELAIYNSNNLEDINGFNNFTQLGSIFISDNNNLKNISGFQNLINIQDNSFSDITIRNNPLLDSISGFSKLAYVQNNFLVYNNPTLNTCCGFFKMVKVGDFGGNIYMTNNAIGCQDTTEIRQAGNCGISIAASGFWSNPNTWDSNSLPNDSDIVIIPSDVTVIVDIQTAKAKKVEVRPGGNLIINDGMMLTIKEEEANQNNRSRKNINGKASIITAKKKGQ